MTKVCAFLLLLSLVAFYPVALIKSRRILRNRFSSLRLVLAQIFLWWVTSLVIVAFRLGLVSDTLARRLSAIGILATVVLCSSLIAQQLNALADRRTLLACCMIALYAATELLSAVVNDQLSLNTAGLGQFAVILVGPSIAIAYLLTFTRDQDGLIRVALLGCAPVVLISLIAGFVDRSDFVLGESRLAELAGNGRLAGATTHANALGLVALTCLVLCLSRSSVDLTGIIICWVSVATLVYTQQRTAIIAGLFVILMRIWLSLRGSSDRIVALIVSSLVGLTAYAIGVTRVVTHQLGAEDTASLQSRTYAWRYVLSQGASPALTGWGPLGLYERTQSSSSLPEQFFHAHNQLLNSWAVGGIALLAITTILTVSVVVGMGKAMKAAQPPSLIAGLALLISFVFESPLHTGLNPLLGITSGASWTLVALSLISSPVATDDDSGESGDGHGAQRTPQHDPTRRAMAH